jgi:hypothetical protein
MMRETEKQLDFKDGSLGLTAEDLEEKIDLDHLDQMKAENFEEYKREQRHREQYIAKLQSQFPDLDIRHIVEREPMKELSTLE